MTHRSSLTSILPHDYGTWSSANEWWVCAGHASATTLKHESNMQSILRTLSIGTSKHASMQAREQGPCVEGVRVSKGGKGGREERVDRLGGL